MYEDLYDEIIYDIINAKTADEYIAAEENHCIFNTVRRDNERIRKQKLDFDAYITSEINRSFDGCKNVDTRILDMIKKMRDKVDPIRPSFQTGMQSMRLTKQCPFR